MIVSAIVFAVLLGLFVFGVLPRARGWRRYASAAVFVLLVAIVYGGSIEMMSRPKPLSLEWRDLAEAEVLGASLREGEAIYLWVAVEGEPAPLAYAMPWSLEAAQQLQGAMGEAQDSGTAVLMGQASEAGLDDRAPMFYPAPQPALPVKDYSAASDAPIIYVQPGAE